MGLSIAPALAIAAVTTYLFHVQQRDLTSQLLLAAFVGLWCLAQLISGLWTCLLYPHLFSPLRYLPEPTGGSWLMGQYPRLSREPTGVPQLEWVNTIPNNGLIRYRAMFNQERLLVTSPQALAEVLTTKNYDFPKPPHLMKSIGRILGIGLFFAEGDEHKRQRKVLLPAFAFRRIKDLAPVFWAKAVESVEAMTAAVTDDAVRGTRDKTVQQPVTLQIDDWASRTALDVIGVAGLGRDFNAIRNPGNELKKTYERAFLPSKHAKYLRILSEFVPAMVLNALPFKRNEDVREAARLIRGTACQAILEKRAQQAHKEPKSSDILSIALESGRFTDEQLVDQVMTFLTAGHVTTASALTWAVFLLCLHPGVQARLRAEIRSSLPSPGDSNALAATNIESLPYLLAVMEESLRYYAVIPLTMREAHSDTWIQGIKVPKGTRVIIAPWATNKATHLWGGDAGEFKPERWLEERNGRLTFNGSGGSKSTYANLSFLHGPRSCIGMQFAKNEMASVLAVWIGRLGFTLMNEEERDERKAIVRGGVTVSKPVNGLLAKVHVVDGW